VQVLWQDVPSHIIVDGPDGCTENTRGIRTTPTSIMPCMVSKVRASAAATLCIHQTQLSQVLHPYTRHKKPNPPQHPLLQPYYTTCHVLAVLQYTLGLYVHPALAHFVGWQQHNRKGLAPGQPGARPTPSEDLLPQSSSRVDAKCSWSTHVPTQTWPANANLLNTNHTKQHNRDLIRTIQGNTHQHGTLPIKQVTNK
jgi:hypothetical protein